MDKRQLHRWMDAEQDPSGLRVRPARTRASEEEVEDSPEEQRPTKQRRTAPVPTPPTVGGGGALPTDRANRSGNEMLLEVAQAMQQQVLEQQAQLKALFDVDEGCRAAFIQSTAERLSTTAAQAEAALHAALAPPTASLTASMAPLLWPPLPPPPPPSVVDRNLAALLVPPMPIIEVPFALFALPPPPPPYFASLPSHAIMRHLFPKLLLLEAAEHAAGDAQDVFSHWRKKPTLFFELVHCTIEEFVDMHEALKDSIAKPRPSTTKGRGEEEWSGRTKSAVLTTDNRLLLLLFWLASYPTYSVIESIFGVDKYFISRVRSTPLSSVLICPAHRRV